MAARSPSRMRLGRRQHLGEGVRGVPAVQQRVEEQAVHGGVGDAGGVLQVLGGVGAQPHGGQAEGDAHVRPCRGDGAQRAGGQPVPEQQVVGDGGGDCVIGQARGVHADPVPVVGDDVRLVHRDPRRHPVAKRLADDGRVLGEPQRGVAAGPAALVLQGLRGVPVEKRHAGPDPALGQRVKEPLVVVEAGLVDRALAALAGGEDPGPGDGEPVGRQAKRLDQVRVLDVAVVGVTGDVAGVAAAHLSRGVAEGVPHRRAPPAGGRRALDLVGGRRRAPGEAGGKRKILAGRRNGISHVTPP